MRSSPRSAKYARMRVRPGQLALRAGGRLQRHGVEPDHLRQHLLQAPHELERPLGAVVLLVAGAGRAKPGSPTARSLIRGLYFIVHEPSG